MPPLTANSLRGALLVLAVLTGVSIQRATAANWPLTGYKSCGSQPLAGPWDDGTEFATADMAYDSDNNLLWLTEGLNLNLFRFSDGTLLSTYTFSSGMSPS